VDGRFSPIGVLLIGLIVAACDQATGTRETAAPKELSCSARDCAGIPDMQTPDDIHGAWTAASMFGPPCRIEAAWPLADGAVGAFHETILVEVGDVFPLHGHVAEVDQCQDMRPRGNGGMFPPMGTLGIDARSEVWAAPGPKSLVVLVRGEAALDGIVAQAAVPSANAGVQSSADVSVGDASWQMITVHRALRAGDTFAWGAYDATIVRLVAPDDRFVGWVEVTVVPHDSATNAAMVSSPRRDAK
jgi:hypothetical protein